MQEFITKSFDPLVNKTYLQLAWQLGMMNECE